LYYTIIEGSGNGTSITAFVRSITTDVLKRLICSSSKNISINK